MILHKYFNLHYFITVYESVYVLGFLSEADMLHQ